MAEQADEGKEEGQEKEQQHADTSGATSVEDLKAQRTHFQSIADKRDGENKALKDELDKLKAAQEAANTQELKEKEEYNKLYEQEKAKLFESEKARERLSLAVALQTHLAEKHPDYAPDFKWISPHVDSEDSIASVVEDYVKAHPKSAGVGAASMGNRGTEGEGQKTVSQADLNDPVSLAALLKEDPDLAIKLERGEIKPVKSV